MILLRTNLKKSDYPALANIIQHLNNVHENGLTKSVINSYRNKLVGFAEEGQKESLVEHFKFLQNGRCTPSIYRQIDKIKSIPESALSPRDLEVLSSYYKWKASEIASSLSTPMDIKTLDEYKKSKYYEDKMLEKIKIIENVDPLAKFYLFEKEKEKQNTAPDGTFAIQINNLRGVITTLARKQINEVTKFKFEFAKLKALLEFGNDREIAKQENQSAMAQFFSISQKPPQEHQNAITRSF